MPNPVQDSKKVNVSSVVTAWDKRFCSTYNINPEVFRSTICFKKKKPEQETRSDADKPLLKDAHIAMWHYHPSLIQFHMDKYQRDPSGKYRNVLQSRTLNVQVMKELNLYHQSGGEEYSSIDLYKKNDVLIVPKYKS